ncbi:MAG: hypothetical protein ACRD0G_15360, partial [Acidimicrobiales bacterium]
AGGAAPAPIGADSPAVDVSDRPPAAGRELPASTDREAEGQEFPLTQVFLAAVLLGGLFLLWLLKPWQWLAAMGRRDEGGGPPAPLGDVIEGSQSGGELDRGPE